MLTVSFTCARAIYHACMICPANCLNSAAACALAHVLPRCRLRKLNLFANLLGPEGFHAIAAVLAATQLTDLNFAANGLDDACGIALAASLPGSRLTSLDISSLWNLRACMIQPLAYAFSLLACVPQ